MMKGLKNCILVFAMIVLALGVFDGTARAATFSVTQQTADSPNEQKFQITNNGNAGTFVVDNTGAEIYVDAGGNAAFTVSGSDRITVTVYRKDDPTDIRFVNSLNQHYVTVYVQYGDNAPQVHSTTTVSLDEGQKQVSVEEMASVGSDIYRCVNPSAYVSYGNASVTFLYSKVQQDPRTVTVYFIDENGYAIGNEQFTIQPGSSATYQAPASVNFNGRNYNLAGGQNAAITQDYSNTTASYTLVYQGEAEQPSTPYNITIQYQDAATGTVLGSDTVTVPVGGTVNFDTPSSYVTSNYSGYQRAEGQPAVITHTSGEETRTYTVLYNQTSEQLPYTISIQLVDSVTGEQLRAESVSVPVNGTGVYQLPGSVDHNGSTYLLASGQGTEIRHAYGSSQRTYYVNYTQQESGSTGDYTLAVRYLDISTGEVIYTGSQAVAGGSSAAIQVPSSYEAGGESYVLLSGQNTNTTHSYYSPVRTYMFYYRNINDTANENAQVSNENVTVVDEATGTETTTVVSTVTTTTPEGEETVTTYDEEGVIIPDEEVPLAPTVPETTAAETEEETEAETEAETIRIEEEEVPLASSVPGDNGSSPTSGILIALVGGIVIVAAAIAVMLVRMRRQKNEA